MAPCKVDFVFVFLSVVVLAFACEEGDPCTTVNDEPGFIMSFIMCKRSKGFNPQLERPCRFSGKIPFICCPPSHVRPASTTTETATAERANTETTATGDSPAENTYTEVRFIRMVEDTCNGFGKRPAEPDEEIPGLDNRVINGYDCKAAEIPHFASLGYLVDEQIAFDCAGALISDNLVLTAAHCCKISRRPFMVRLGKTSADLLNPKDRFVHMDVNISEITPHPEYKPRYKYHDIALLRLEHDVEFSFNIWPACIYPEADYGGKRLIIAGMGRNDLINATSRSNWLQKASVKEVPLDECKEEIEKAYNGVALPGVPQGILNEMLCANNRKVHTDTCEGDSGSALQFKKDDKFYIVGVTSFGVSCGTSLPSFYTRVASYLDWIEEVL